MSRPLRPRPQPKRMSACIWCAQNFNDAQQVADKYKSDIPVILNLQGTGDDLAKRLIDFSSGLAYALDGGMQRVADKVVCSRPGMSASPPKSGRA